MFRFQAKGFVKELESQLSDISLGHCILVPTIGSWAARIPTPRFVSITGEGRSSTRNDCNDFFQLRAKKSLQVLPKTYMSVSKHAPQFVACHCVNQRLLGASQAQSQAPACDAKA